MVNAAKGLNGREKDMKAAEICLNTKKLMENKREIYGHVHSVFNRVCNIVTNEDVLIPVISSSVPNTPRSISVSLPSKGTIAALGFKRGMGVTIKNNTLATAEDGFKLDLSCAKVWDPRPVYGFERVHEQQLLKNLDYLYRIFLQEGNFNGIALVCRELVGILAEKSAIKLVEAYSGEPPEGNHYSSFIFPRLTALLEAYWQWNTDLVRSSTRQIVGFGPGLTPSADDFLAGFMVASLYSADYYKQGLDKILLLNRAAIGDAKHRTTKVSSEMLFFAAGGEVSDNIRALILSLFSVSEQNALLNNIRSVISNGETSGSDLIAGIYIGCLLSVYNRKEMTEYR